MGKNEKTGEVVAVKVKLMIKIILGHRYERNYKRSWTFITSAGDKCIEINEFSECS